MRLESGAVVLLNLQFVFIKFPERADLPPLSNSGPILCLIDRHAPSHIDTNRWTLNVFLAHHWRSTFRAELECISTSQVKGNRM